MGKWTQRELLQTATLILVVLACVYMVIQLRPVWDWALGLIGSVATPFVVALIISYLLNPVVEALVKRRVPRGISILIIYAIFLLISAVAAVQGIPALVEQVKALAANLPETVNRIDQWLNELARQTRYLPDGIQQAVENHLNQMERWTGRFLGQVVASLGATVGQLLSAFVVPFLVFYLLKDLKMVERVVLSLAPREQRDSWKKLLQEIDDALGRYVRGQLLVMALVGVLTYAGYLIIGLPFSLLMASIVAVANIIPYVGPFIGLAPAALIGLTISPAMALKVLLVNLIVQQIESNLISPTVVGRSLDIHPLAIIFALLLGGQLAGIAGMVFAVPVLAVLRVIGQHWSSFRKGPV
ncbi:AI-2E family transporter [Kyrpidia sp.]|uniref:AI-2E family transporter n=1 Tax=Kyrpidia sp. TaxID=2073077 RepID=UPI002587DA19|nr:AI-2E family transporter [Kyrpidia sp.]MCL6576805.1 AI-2E family transporter [Kyrpidia sp.]